MDMEGFLAELRAAREAGVRFELNQHGEVRAAGPFLAGRDPFGVLLSMRGGKPPVQSPIRLAGAALGMDDELITDVFMGLANLPWGKPSVRARLLEACGLNPAGEETL